MSNICLVGEVIVDLTLYPVRKIRLGGIMHAARALWAVEAAYEILYIAPSYLRDEIDAYSKSIGAQNVVCIGEVTGAPNLILINEAKEIGNQGYELILNEEYKVNYNLTKVKEVLSLSTCSDFLFFTGQFDLPKLIEPFKNRSVKIHADIANNIFDLQILSSCAIQFDTLIISTSSDLFLNYFEGNINNIRNVLQPTYCKSFLFKENRGGARFFSDSSNVLTVGAQLRDIAHSVGVGDCYDAIFILKKRYATESLALIYASWIAADYATTSFPDDFKQLASRTNRLELEFLENNPGIRIPWEDRKHINIYIAAPDFDFKDTTLVDSVCKSLLYHNYSPRRPVKENGQMEIDASVSRRQELYEKDILVLKECQMVIAILTEYDPGTLIEIGYASAIGIPVILFDPFNMATNCMLTQSCYAVIKHIEEVIDQVFILSSQN